MDLTDFMSMAESESVLQVRVGDLRKHVDCSQGGEGVTEGVLRDRDVSDVSAIPALGQEWVDMRVLEQVQDVLAGRHPREHVEIPASYKSGVTIFAKEATAAHAMLLAEPAELPRLEAAGAAAAAAAVASTAAAPATPPAVTPAVLVAVPPQNTSA
jgi:hypothetical protein